MTHTSVPPTVREAVAVDLDGVAVLSVDVFDTLMFRRCGPEVHLHPAIAAKLDAEGGLRAPVTPEQFSYYRGKALAWAAARCADGRHPSLTDFYAALPDWLCDRDRAMAVETALETEQAILNPIIADLIAAAHARGIPVWLLSDMHLPKQTIERMLVTAGLDWSQITDLWVSAALGISKQRGDMFRRLLDVTGVSPDTILHIGDNADGDVAVPRTLGLRAIAYRPSAHAAEIARRERFFLPGPPAAHGRHAGLVDVARRMALAHGATGAVADDPGWFWFDLGAGVVGPAMVSYANACARVAVEQRARVILAFRREARMLAPLIRRRLEGLGVDIPVREVAVSREATFLPWMRDVASFDLSQHARDSRLMRFADFLVTCGLTEGEIPPPIAALGALTLVEVNARPEIHAWWRTLIPLLEDKAKQARRRFVAYVQAILGPDPEDSAAPILTVDLGAGGTVQGRLGDILELELGQRPPFLHCLFYAAKGRVSTGRGPDRFYAYTGLSSKTLADNSHIYRSPQILELILNGRDQTVSGYREAPNGAVEPVFLAPPVWSDAQHAAIDAVDRGVRHYAWILDRLGTRHPDQSLEDPEIASTAILRLIRLPTAREATLLGDLDFDFNDGTRHMVRLCRTGMADHQSVDDVIHADPIQVPWPQAVITRKDPDLLLEQFESCFGTVQERHCRRWLAEVARALEADPAAELALYCAGGHGGLGPMLIERARMLGLTISLYMDVFDSDLEPVFHGIPTCRVDELPRHSPRHVLVATLGYAGPMHAALAKEFPQGGVVLHGAKS